MQKSTSLLMILMFFISCTFVEAQMGNGQAVNFKNNFRPANLKLSTAQTLKLKIDKALKSESARVLRKKNTDKQLLTVVELDWEDSDNSWDTSSTFNYTWNTNNEPVEMIYRDFEDGELQYIYTITEFVKLPAGQDGDFLDGYTFKKAIGKELVNNVWTNYFNFTATLSAEGNQEETIEQTWENNAWVNDSRSTYAYNQDGRMTLRQSYNWENNNWVNNSKEETFFDAQGRELGYELQSWVNNQWETDYGQKREFTYNGSNQVTGVEVTRFNETIGQWRPQIRQAYTLNASGEITEIVEEYFADTAWITNARYENINWHTFNTLETYGYPFVVGGDKFSSYQVSRWDGANWVMQERVSSKFNTASLLTERVSEFYQNASWDSASKQFITYYPNNDFKESVYYRKDNNNWIIQSGYDYVNTYDTDGDMLTTLSRSWNSDVNTFVNNYQTIYTYNTTVGVADAKFDAGFSIFPNPSVNGTITVSLKDASAGANVSATLINQLGQVVMVKNITQMAKEFTLDVSSLSNGVYFLNINNNGKLSNSKVVIK